MLRSTHIKTRTGETTAKAAGRVTKYLRSEKEERDQKTGYYSRNEALSMWLGRGAEALGLEGAVADKDLHELLQGHLPDGTDLSQRGGRAAQARLGTDITLSAPKSFSIMATHDSRLIQLWDKSVKVAAAFIEKEIITARLGKGGATVEHTGQAVIAGYRHEDTRTVDGVADMDLHAHLLTLNMTRRQDGTWCRMDLGYGDSMVLAFTTDFMQKAWLSDQVQRLGYSVRVTQDGFEFDAVAQDQIDAFSRRTAQMDEWLKAHNINPHEATDAQREQACLATRGSKTQLGHIDQQYEWRARTRAQGMDLDRVVREAKARGPIKTTGSPEFAMEAVRAAARHVGERESVFSRDATRLEALKAGMGGATLETVEAAMQAKAAGLLDVGGGKMTTRETLLREQEILARMRAGRGMVSALMTGDQVAVLIEKTEKDGGRTLSEGQKAAIRLVLTTGDRTVGVVGGWGVGKTTGAIQPIAAAAKDLGLHTIGITPTTRARKELAGAKTDELMTIASWLGTKPETRPDGTIIHNDNRLVVMDEAGMVDASTLDAVQKKLAREGGRMFMVGDPQQLRSILAGKPFQQAMETESIAYVKISEVQRQTDARLKEMAQLWTDGKTVAAVKIAKEHMKTVALTDRDWQAAKGRVSPPRGDKEPTVPRDVRQAAIVRETANAYMALSPEQREDTVTMAATNKLRVAINSEVREGLKTEGAVEGEDAILTALDKVDLTTEQLSRPESYAGRQDLIVRMPQGRGENRKIVDFLVRAVDKDRVVLEGLDGKQKIWNPATARNPQVYSSREIALAVGDEINFRDSSGLRDTLERIENGEDGRIVRIDPDGPVVEMEDGREITLRSDQNHAIDYGYCRTVHKAQGMTKDRALYAVESVGARAIGQIAGVACTRERAALQIITDNPELTGAAMEKWATHQAAMEATKAEKLDLETVKELRQEAKAALGRTGDLSLAREDLVRDKQEREKQRVRE